MSTFDELYEDFLGGDKPKKRTRKKKKTEPSKFGDELRGLMDTLSKFREITNPDEQYEIDNEYGPADKIEYFAEDELFFKRSTWAVDGGEIVKLEVSDAPFAKDEEIDKKSLDELLQDALDSENYELAAEIRDEINKNKKN